MGCKVDILTFLKKRVCLLYESVALLFLVADIHNGYSRFFDLLYVLHIYSAHLSKLNKMLRSCINIRTTVYEQGVSFCCWDERRKW